MTQEDAKVAFTTAFEEIVAKCALFAVDAADITDHTERLLISFYDVCAACKFCPHCLGARVHDRMGLVYIETKLGANTLIPVVDRDYLLGLILNIKTEATVDLQNLWALATGPGVEDAPVKFSDDDEEFLKSLWKE